MLDASIAALIALGYAYVVWVLFLAVMALRQAWPTLPIFTRVLAVPAVLTAILLDIVFNALVSVPLAEMPQEWTFSQRMGRYKGWAPLRPDHWRVKLAQWVCANLLDPFELGGHCHA